MEFVYVVRRRDLFPTRAPHGLEVMGQEELAGHMDRMRRHGFFVERRHAENDPELKQLIPYAVMVRDTEVFLMRRLPGAGEARLHGKRSVGVGGHVNPVDDGPGDDDSGRDVLETGLRREIEEEVAVSGTWRARAVGVLNDDTTAVGAVHFGLVYAVSVESGAAVTVREGHALTGGFVSRADLAALHRDERETFETWSALVIDRLDAVVGSPAPAGIRGPAPSGTA